jgi:hypothetical protein
MPRYDSGRDRRRVQPLAAGVVAATPVRRMGGLTGTAEWPEINSGAKAAEEGDSYQMSFRMAEFINP